ncbi:MAG: hypothetical protein AB7K09_11295 [Planctomycetota bacterium]
MPDYLSSNTRYASRPARPDEAATVRALWREFIAEQIAGGYCENDWELPDVIDAFDARLEAAVECGWVALLIERASGSAVGFLAGLAHEADARIPPDALLITDLYLQPAHRLGATGLPLWPCIREQAAAAGKSRLVCSTHERNRLMLLVLGRLGFAPAPPLPFEVSGHSWWQLMLEGSSSVSGEAGA